MYRNSHQPAVITYYASDRWSDETEVDSDSDDEVFGNKARASVKVWSMLCHCRIASFTLWTASCST